MLTLNDKIMNNYVSIAGAGQALKKPLLIMKLTLVLTVFCVLQSWANLNGQTVTLNAQDVEISKVLTNIEKQGNFRFLYNSRLKDLQTKVNFTFANADITEVLASLFNGTTLSYKRLENNLIAIRSENLEVPQDNKITGRVTGEAGEALSGVSITVKGSTRGTVTDNNGNFTLVAPDNATLVVSAIGYEPQEVAVNKQTVFNVKLILSQKKLDEVVVIGYGTASKRDLTGTIAKIAGKEIADKPNLNPVASLQGKVAGLSVVNSGTPGQEPDIRIRGTNSLSPSGVKPLYLVDGIFNDNINFLNPNDIESIEILKDPSSLAIFGVRGANGVIAITTKKAKAGQILVNLNTTFGTKKLVDKIAMVNASEFRTLFEEEQANLGITGSDLFDFTPWTGNTDWVDAMTRTGKVSTTNLSVAGASDRNKFYMGVGYTNEEGVIKNEKLQKITFNINDEFKLNKAIKIGFTLNGIRQRNPFGRARDLLFQARRVLPITPVFNEAKGAYTNLAIQSGQMINPAMELNDLWDKELNYENRMVASVYADVNIFKQLNLRSTFYADMSNVEGRNYTPIDSLYDPISNSVFIHNSYRRTGVSQSNMRWNKFQQDHILTFKQNIGDHGITAMGGFTTYYNEFRGMFGSVKQSLTGNPIPNNKRFWYIDNGFGDASTRVSSSGQWEKATVSTLFRLLYNYQGKYMLNASFRRDLSSAWRQDYGNQGQNFYSVGAAWDVSREDFFDNQKIFDYFKLKASWGVLGVQNTYGFDYPAYPALSSAATAVFGNIIVPVYRENYLADPNLHWETVDSKEIGFEFDAVGRRLHGEFAYYTKTTKDLLALINTGVGTQTLTNIGNMRNKGIELSLSYTQPLAKDLTLSVSGNLTTYDNKFLESPYRSTPDEQFPSMAEAGYPIGYFYGYKVAGVFQSYAEKLKYPVQSLGNSYGPGDLRYEDVNGDGVITPDDRTMIGNPTPDFTYGGNVTLRYKNLDFGVDLQGVYGNEVYRYWGSSELPFTKFNYPAFKMNRWHGEGTSNWDPILGDNHTTNRLPSTYGIEDGSYLRVRNLQVGYNVNNEMLKGTFVKSIRVFLNVQNLKTWKKNSGYSPEFGGSPTSFGVDTGNDPLPRIISGGINVNF